MRKLFVLSLALSVFAVGSVFANDSALDAARGPRKVNVSFVLPAPPASPSHCCVCDHHKPAPVPCNCKHGHGSKRGKPAFHGPRPGNRPGGPAFHPGNGHGNRPSAGAPRPNNGGPRGDNHGPKNPGGPKENPGGPKNPGGPNGNPGAPNRK